MHLENVWWMFAGGLLFTIVVLLARGSQRFDFSPRKTDRVEIKRNRHYFGGGVSEQNHPVPLLIWLLLLAYLPWAVAYVFYISQQGL
jgi:hypothetical protein